MHVKSFLVGACAAMLVAASASDALAQGCILLRQTAPIFGTTGSLDSDVGSWTITFNGRSSIADQHYRGSVYQAEREHEQTYVVNRQNSVTATVGYQLSPRVSLMAGIPFIESSWGIPSPRTGGPGARANENARGLGDVTTLARFALFNPSTSARSWNVIVGGGVKFPTGNNEATDIFPDGNGNNNVERYVDISVHPGDGGWGAIMDFQAYKQFGRITTFGGGTWLANPRDTGTASRGNMVSNLAPSNINTVSDQFVFRAGGSVPITNTVTATLAWRVEGVPRYDLFGHSNGFRRPGVTMYWEPGVTVMQGRHAVSFNLPVGYYFNRWSNPNSGNAGDSTFPEYVSIVTYSVPLGGKSSAHTVPARPASDQPATPRTPEVVRPGEGA